ncbi:PAS domain S-box protein [Phormidesmis sp. 146-12]
MFTSTSIRLQQTGIAVLALLLFTLMLLLVTDPEKFLWAQITLNCCTQDPGLGWFSALIPTIGIFPLAAMTVSSEGNSWADGETGRSWHSQDQSQNEPEQLQGNPWFRAIAEGSLDAVYLLKSVRNSAGEVIDFQFLDLNEQGANLISRRRAEVIDQRLCELLPINRAAGFFERYKQVVESGIALEEEFSTEGMPGVATQWLRHRVVRFEDGIVITSRDVTERKQAEIALADREQLYRTLAELMPQMVWQLNAEGQIKYANQHWQRGLGVTPEQINQTGWEPILHPEELAYLNPRWQRAFEQGVPNEDEFRYRMADGSYRWFLGRVVPIKDEQGQVIKWIGTSTDIDDRKRVEQELQQREQQFRTLAENSPDIIARVDRNLRHLYVNPAITKATGLAPEVFIGKSNAEMGMPLELNQFWESKLNRVFATGQPDSYEFNFPAPDGTRYYLSRVIPEFADNGEVATILGITSDITDLKQAEQSLRQSEARFRRVVESNMIGLGFWNLKGDILSANDALLTMLGYTQEEFRSQPLSWREITPHEHETVVNKALQEIAEQGFCTPFEKEYICKDGSHVPILCGGATFEDSSDGGVFFVIDLTERKKIESECERLLKLERAARQEAEAANRIKDEFLSVISHELRTPLNPILGWIKLLKNHRFDAARTEQALSSIDRNARLQAQLVEDLLDVSQILQGKLSLSYCPVNVVEPVEAAIATVRLSAEAKSIQLHTALDHTIGRVLGNPSRIQQVTWNLLANAIKFTPVGGRVEITLESVGAFAQIQVSDTGKGIEPEFLLYIFDYFRQADGSITRRFGGLGLGLAIARHLVELHGGTIEAASMGAEKGAIFTVRLPLLQNDPKPPEPLGDRAVDSPQPLPEPCLDETLEGLKILLVDHETESLEMMTLALRQAGATVIATPSIQEALQTLTELTSSELQPNVLISDVTMPDEDGYSLMQQIQLLHPDLLSGIWAIALTTSASETDEHQTLAAGYQSQISKPVAPGTLISTIATLTQSIPRSQDQHSGY